MKTLLEIFPRASAATVAANPQMLVTNGGSVKPKRGVMNKTEESFARILDDGKRSGEILRYEFEGITLRWADMRYTPDFVVFVSTNLVVYRPKEFTIKLIEVKGGHIWDRDIVRYKGARAYWPEFAFEMWQLKKGQGWKRKY